MSVNACVVAWNLSLMYQNTAVLKPCTTNTTFLVRPDESGFYCPSTGRPTCNRPIFLTRAVSCTTGTRTGSWSAARGHRSLRASDKEGWRPIWKAPQSIRPFVFLTPRLLKWWVAATDEIPLVAAVSLISKWRVCFWFLFL